MSRRAQIDELIKLVLEHKSVELSRDSITMTSLCRKRTFHPV